MNNFLHLFKKNIDPKILYNILYGIYNTLLLHELYNILHGNVYQIAFKRIIMNKFLKRKIMNRTNFRTISSDSHYETGSKPNLPTNNATSSNRLI